MKLNTFFIALVTMFSLHSCSNNESNLEDEFTDENGYVDGTYCAEINYYYPETGTRATYNLNVEVENNEVTKIFWGNGGWLDEDYFYPEMLNSEGYCSFTTDKGYEYEVKIISEECSNTDITKFQREVENDIESISCPKCGDEKDFYDDYCSDCQDDIDHTCKRCGEIDNFMSTFDDYCGDCEDELEHTCKKCGTNRYNVKQGMCDDCREKF